MNRPILEQKLTKTAKNPLNVYACYTKRVQKKLSVLKRSTKNFVENLEKCEKIIKEQLMPSR